MARDGEWRSREVIAWTDNDGPGRPPEGLGRVVPYVLAIALGVVFVGMLGSDTLCPEHRAWVMILGAVGIVGTGAAIVGLVQGWAVSPLLTVGVSVIGLAIGLIDATHDPTRGRLIALGFGISAVLASVLAVAALRLTAWEHRVRSQLYESHDAVGPSLHVADRSEPAAPVHDRSARAGVDSSAGE